MAKISEVISDQLESIQAQYAINKNNPMVPRLQYANVNIREYEYLVENNDWANAIDKAIDDLYIKGGGELDFTPDTFEISHEILLKPNVILNLNKAILKATASMPTMIGTDVTTQHKHGKINGGKLDCNGLAIIGIHLRYFAVFRVSDTVVENPALIHVKLGSSLAPQNSYEAVLFRVTGDRQRPIPQPTGSIGLLLENATDNVIDRCVFVGAETGVKTITGASGNNFLNVHVWSRLPENVITDGFVIESSSNFFTNCTADTVQRYGFHVKNWRNVFIACRVYNNSSGPNNQTIGVRLAAVSQYVTMIGMIFQGEDNSIIAKDIEFEDDSLMYSNMYNIYGSCWTYCSTRTIIGLSININSNTTDIDFPFMRNYKTLWQLRCDTNNDFTLVQRDNDGGSWVRDAIRADRDLLTVELSQYLIIDNASWPLPDAQTYRGAIARIDGDSDGADKLYFSLKNADNTYSWKEIQLVEGV